MQTTDTFLCLESHLPIAYCLWLNANVNSDNLKEIANDLSKILPTVSPPGWGANYKRLYKVIKDGLHCRVFRTILKTEGNLRLRL